MQEGLKQFRKRFVDAISGSGVTKIYFGDVVNIFDKVLIEYGANLDVAAPISVSSAVTVSSGEIHGPSEEPKALPPVAQVYTDPNNPFLQAEESLKVLLSNKTATRGKQVEEEMPVSTDPTDEQPNKELIERQRAHTKEHRGK